MVYILHVSRMRPPSYFILLSICSGLLAISIFLSNTKTENILQIIKIYLISFTSKYSIYIIAGVVPGVDPWTHAGMNRLLAQTGNIKVLYGKEIDFPIMHVQNAVTQILTNTSIKEATNFAIIVPFILITIFIYLFTRDIFGERVGLLAMLIVNTSDFHIYWGSSPQTTTFGVVFYYLIMYIIFRRYSTPVGEKWKREKWASFSLILIFILIYTHAVSSFIFLMTLTGLTVGAIIYQKIIDNKESPLLGNTATITLIFLLQHWFTTSYSKGGKSFFDGVASTFIYYITENADILNRPESFHAYSSMLPPFGERYLDTLSLSILLFFAVIGCLFWLSPKYICKLNFAFIMCTTTLLFITFIFPFFGIRNILPSRWFIFEYFLLSVMAAFSITRISESFKNQKLNKVFLGSSFFILVFFMSSVTVSNLDSPLWLKESTISTTYTHSEVRGAETLSRYSDNLSSDIRFGYALIGFISDPNDTFIELKEENLNQSQTVIWRDYMLARPVRYSMKLDGYYKPVIMNKVLGPEFLEKLNRHNKIYQNGNINGYDIQ